MSLPDKRAAGRSSQETKLKGSLGYSKNQMLLQCQGCNRSKLGDFPNTMSLPPTCGKSHPRIMLWFKKNKGWSPWTPGSSLCIWPHGCLLGVLGMSLLAWESRSSASGSQATRIRKGIFTHSSVCRGRHTFEIFIFWSKCPHISWGIHVITPRQAL